MRPDRDAAAAMTGGQYSVVRCVIAVPVAALYTARVVAGEGGIATALVAIAAAAMAAGFRDRWWALVLLPVFLVEAASGGGFAGPVGLAAVAALHTTAPPAPYGSLDARGRPDPGGGWTLSARFVRRAWRVLGIVALLRAAEVAAHGGPAAPALALGAAIGGLAALRGRPTRWLWNALAVLLGASVLLGAPPLAPLAIAAALAVTLSPAWLPPETRQAPFLLFYDGACGLCHRAVRFLLAEDRAALFRFAPLGGPTFEATVTPERRAGLPDSMVLHTAGGALLVGAAGALAAGLALGGWWRLGAVLGGLVPRAVAEAAYRAVARVRRRLFRRPEGVCPLVPEALRGRFPDLAA